MTMKGPSRKQIIVLISKVKVNNILALANEHITNINRALKNIKLNVMVDFIWPDNLGITIISNLVVSQSDLQAMERYVKSIDNVSLDEVQVPRLLQLKSYLKIIVPFCVESKVQSVPSTMDCTRASTTVSSLGAAKLTSRQTLQDWKQSKENHVPILSSA